MILVTIWVLVSAWLCAMGWVLSALKLLNGTGYLLALAATMLGCLALKKHWWPAGGFARPNWRKWLWRFRRPAPLIFLAIALSCLASGLCYPPENGDSNAYRLPRVLHWLSESGWHWIRTEDSRQNISGCGYEWLFVPLKLVTGSDRWFFLPNIIAYLLLPGMLFSFFRHLRMAARTAWWWAWLVASGWCYTMQACSSDNDSISTVYVLAAVVFALRAHDEQRTGLLWLSMLAASVFSGIKPTNLPLLLPCVVAMWLGWRLLLKRPFASAIVVAIGMLASCLPIAYLNWVHTGSWKGYLPPSGPIIWWHWGPAQELGSPFWGFIGNTFCLTAQNLLPPFFPWATEWNNAMNHFLQTPFGAHFASFEGFGRLSRSIKPTTAGLGLHVIFMVLISLVAALSSRRKRTPKPRTISHQPSTNIYQRILGRREMPAIYRWIRWTPWLALAVFMAKVGAYQNARYLASYYPFLLLAPLLSPGLAPLVRSHWWQRLALALMTLTLAFMMFVHGRNFVPLSIYARLHEAQGPKFLRVLDDYYQARLAVAAYWDFGQRHAAGEPVVGYSCICAGSEPGMWRPWGHGRVERVLPDDSPEWVRSRGIRGVFVEDSVLRENHETIEQWLQRFNAVLVDEMTFATDPGAPRTHLYFVRLQPLNP